MSGVAAHFASGSGSYHNLSRAEQPWDDHRAATQEALYFSTRGGGAEFAGSDGPFVDVPSSPGPRHARTQKPSSPLSLRKNSISIEVDPVPTVEQAVINVEGPPVKGSKEAWHNRRTLAISLGLAAAVSLLAVPAMFWQHRMQEPAHIQADHGHSETIQQRPPQSAAAEASEALGEGETKVTAPSWQPRPQNEREALGAEEGERSGEAAKAQDVRGDVEGADDSSSQPGDNRSQGAKMLRGDAHLHREGKEDLEATAVRKEPAVQKAAATQGVGTDGKGPDVNRSAALAVPALEVASVQDGARPAETTETTTLPVANQTKQEQGTTEKALRDVGGDSVAALGKEEQAVTTTEEAPDGVGGDSVAAPEKEQGVTTTEKALQDAGEDSVDALAKEDSTTTKEAVPVVWGEAADAGAGGSATRAKEDSTTTKKALPVVWGEAADAGEEGSATRAKEKAATTTEEPVGDPLGAARNDSIVVRAKETSLTTTEKPIPVAPGGDADDEGSTAQVKEVAEEDTSTTVEQPAGREPAADDASEDGGALRGKDSSDEEGTEDKKVSAGEAEDPLDGGSETDGEAQATPDKAGEQGTGGNNKEAPPQCQTAMKGDKCFKDVIWAMTVGIHEHPDWYQPDLTEQSSFGEFQAWLHAKNQAGCAKPCGEPCLCLFDVDRTLTAGQNYTAVCPGTAAVPGVADSAFGGGTLVLSELAQHIPQSFCGRCYRGIVTAGDAGGTTSDERGILMQMLGGNDATLGGTWTSTDAVGSLLVFGAEEGHKQESVRSMLDWVKTTFALAIQNSHVYFFDDSKLSVSAFLATEFNAQQVSCDSRSDPGEVGQCGATSEEVVQRSGVKVCSAELKIDVK